MNRALFAMALTLPLLAQAPEVKLTRSRVAYGASIRVVMPFVDYYNVPAYNGDARILARLKRVRTVKL